MAQVDIRPFQPQDISCLPEIITGYVTSEIYTVNKIEHEGETSFSLRLEPLPTPKTIVYDHLDEAELTRLADVVAEGLSLAAVADERLIGVTLASVEPWNQSLRAWEFHVAKAWRGQGIGRRMMERVVETAVSNNLRVIVCETQSRNVPAIRFYRKMGFALDAIDLSFYSNEDVAKESVALFMKRKL
jgi:ribosomal protein S18 acetylase RimI-like enzyme